MKAPILPPDETERLGSLKSLDILDSIHEERFDRLTRLAKRMFDVSIAVVSLIDEKRQWFKSCEGLGVEQTNRDISFCGHTILEEQTFIIPDATKDERFYDNPLVIGEPFVRFYAGRQIKTPEGYKIGTLCIMDNEPRTLSEDDILSLNDLAEMVEREIMITHIATIDDLTQISNRRGFVVLADHDLKRCARQGLSATLVFFDLNKFKYINDTFGHAEGDKALIIFADILKSTLRTYDVIGRLGGDEFVVLLTESSEQNTNNIISRCRQLLDQQNLNAHQDYEIGFSYGVAEFDPYAHLSVESMINKADSIMYQNKQNKS